MYRVETTVNPEEYDAFVSGHVLHSLLQSYHWYEVKQEWNHCHFLIYRHNTIVGAGLLLYREIGKIFRIGYIPRGPILDYTDKPLVEFTMKSITQLAVQHQLDTVIFDPKMVYQYKNKKSSIVNDDILKIKAHLESLSIKHIGFTKYMNDTIQPRHEAVISLEQPLEHTVFSSTKQIIRRSLKKHITIVEHDASRLRDFDHILRGVEKRHGIKLRNIQYFRRLLECYAMHAHLSFAEIDVCATREKVIDRLEDLNAQKQLLVSSPKRIKLMEDEEKMLHSYLSELNSVHEKKIVLACNLSIGYADTYEMLYGGVSEQLKSTHAQYALDYAVLEYAQKLGYKKVSMGGISEHEHDGLRRYKSQFGAITEEYIGEFHIINNHLKYALFSTLRKLLAYIKADK
ncbi:MULTISPECIES: peptidoglycan bridge formation glycyltransferase FemA/FemB family protein [unclassified Granulicatella]|uniref:lipid II:glycine glycyltransferase FemX n=1 Tax=unclassified Granulicatella TaxID=2630493 RepID=UPI0010747FAE|nr:MULTISPECIES: peptidoglycan bridge formation glycyltransferase FemA/FemB family protein [unclassified Granulicatella]MBF0780152.1 peptidoglycan bridge formation glycyltransferase FemA/FemB family protein [Granulicatella sp. 19428wC4_WM01]TFU95756.1 peptidoglycan bridge formation glycyltransferase FemA/FemB family protein [Granulicatella sp. WM01]